jgi:hypothetical protein
MTSQVRMTIVIRTGVGKTPNVTPDRFSPARTATRAAEADEANRTSAGAPLRGAVFAEERYLPIGSRAAFQRAVRGNIPDTER